MTDEDWALVAAIDFGSVHRVWHGGASRKWYTYHLGERDVTTEVRRLTRLRYTIIHKEATGKVEIIARPF
jgi:hypothetical protein